MKWNELECNGHSQSIASYLTLFDMMNQCGMELRLI